MDLKIDKHYFVVGGAGSGFGKAICLALANEGSQVLAVSRTLEKLEEVQKLFPHNIDILGADITLDETHDLIMSRLQGKSLKGILVNGGGPPAGNFQEIKMQQWDESWKKIVSWKIALTKKLLPILSAESYGRILFIESVSVKQMVPNLILSNALRPAVVGFAKTLSREVADQGINVNILAPGYHLTPALERLFVKKSELEGISVQEAQKAFEIETPVKPMGQADEMAGLALWLLSPLSRFVTGQTITHDGGIVHGLWG